MEMTTETIDAESRALVVRDEVEPQALALPAILPAEAKAAMKAYQELCEAVLESSDYQEFTQKKKVDGRWVSEIKKFKKKSAVKKLQTFFGVEVTVKSADRDELGDGHYAFRVIASARARNGRVVEATGACSTLEERFDLQPFDDESDTRFAIRQRKALARAYHDILSTAETRATNRAVMNCIGVGGGEVTADEVQRDRAQPRQEAPAQQRPADPEVVKRGLMTAAKIRMKELGMNDEQWRDLLRSTFPDVNWNERGFDGPTGKALDKPELETLNSVLKARQ